MPSRIFSFKKAQTVCNAILLSSQRHEYVKIRQEITLNTGRWARNQQVEVSTKF